MHDRPSRIRRIVVAVAKVALAVAILAYLLNQAREHDTFTQLVEQPKRWPLLAAGFVCAFTSILLTFVRWHLFVRAVGISLRLLETMRLGARIRLELCVAGLDRRRFFQSDFLGPRAAGATHRSDRERGGRPCDGIVHHAAVGQQRHSRHQFAGRCPSGAGSIVRRDSERCRGRDCRRHALLSVPQLTGPRMILGAQPAARGADRRPFARRRANVSQSKARAGSRCRH